MNLKNEFLKVDNYFPPKIIGEVNDQFLKAAKIKGQEIPWHNHESEDELFYIVEGTLLMEIEHQENFAMQKRDFYIVKKGIHHRVSSKEECLIILVESKTIEHTGKVKSQITKSIDEQKY